MYSNYMYRDLHSSIFDSYRAITPTIGPMAKPQPTVTRPLVHSGAGSHPLCFSLCRGKGVKVR